MSLESSSSEVLSVFAQNFVRVIDKKFDSTESRNNSTARKHEEKVAGIPSSQLDECPTAERFYLTRPIPEEEALAQRMWHGFGGHRLTVHEAKGAIQTDFSIQHGGVYKRQIVNFPSDNGPVGTETEGDFLLRRSKEMLGDALSMVALKGAVERENIGVPLNEEACIRLISWIEHSEIV